MCAAYAQCGHSTPAIDLFQDGMKPSEITFGTGDFNRDISRGFEFICFNDRSTTAAWLMLENWKLVGSKILLLMHTLLLRLIGFIKVRTLYLPEAAESVLRHVTEVLPGNDELLAAAVEDSRLASVIEAYSDVNFIFGVQEADRTLYILVALLYLTDYENLRDLAASSALQAGELLLLSEFGKTLNAESLRDVEDDAEVRDFLNKLFEDFCNSLGIKVEHTSRSEDCKVPIRLDARPLKPARPCQSPRLHGRAARAVPVPGPRHLACPRDVPARTRRPVDRSLESHLPGEQAAVLQSLRDFAVQAYSQAVFDGRAWEVDDFAACLPLRAAEARELLLAREQSEAVNCLVFKRPSSFVSDEMVVADGAERARLYLVQAGLRVSYNLPLTYAASHPRPFCR